MGQRIRSGDHHVAWNMLLPLIENAVRGPELKAIARRMIVRAFAANKGGGPLKRLAVELGARA